MVKKVQKPALPKFELPAGLRDNPLAQSVKESAQQIWLAGMGAFAKAQEGRLKVFESLIKEGTHLQRRTQSAAEEKIGEVTDRMSAMAGDVTAKAGHHWDKLETIFEQRTAKAMNKLGVPTAKDVDALIKRVDELAAAVQRLSKAGAPKAAAPAAKAARSAPPAKKAAKPAAKKTAPRKKAGA
ncbi:MAG TPA: phasin family protein [Rubrivivax sp.]|nr:phasin family protein [Rubrivivax sp.]